MTYTNNKIGLKIIVAFLLSLSIIFLSPNQDSYAYTIKAENNASELAQKDEVDHKIEDKLDEVGARFFKLIRSAGYWIVIILCSKKVLTLGLHGRNDEIGGCIVSHTIMFATLYFLPWIFDMIKDIFV